MPRDRYPSALRLAYQGEVFGEAVYSTMARLTLRPARRGKLHDLREIEAATRDRLRGALAENGGAPRPSAAARVLGAAAALALAPLPWRWQLRMLRTVVAGAAPALERFERQHGPRDPSLAATLVEHERAQLAMLDRELA